MKKKVIIIIPLFFLLLLGWKLFIYVDSNKVDKALDKLSLIETDIPINYPNDEKYKYLVALQLKRWDIAEKLLAPLAKKNDPEAIYWLAFLSGDNAFSGKKMAESFEKSAKLGNMYSAMQLSPNGYYCDTYLKGICSDKWLEKVKGIYEEKVKNNIPLLDKYYYKVGLNANKINLDSELTYIVYNNANAGNYQPLVDYIRYITKNYNLNHHQKSLVKKILSVPIEHDYIPALQLAYFMGNKYKFDTENIIRTLSSLEVYCVACIDYYSEKVKTRKSSIEIGTFMIVHYTLDNTKDINKFYRKSDLLIGSGISAANLTLSRINESSLNDSEIQTMIDQSLKILNNRKIQVHINEGNYRM